MSFGEFLKSLRAKMVGEALPVPRIAAGWALGMFVGCFIPFGMQLIVSVPLAVGLRISRVGATVATFITNPITIIFIYPAQTWLGSRVVGSPLDWTYLKGVCARLGEVSLFSADGWRTLGEIGGRILGGFFAGGLLFALVTAPITYLLVARIVTKYRKRRNG